MRLSKIAYALFAGALAIALLLQSGVLAAAGGRSPLWQINGSYSSIFSGYLVATPLQPFAGTGLFISDGKGNLTGHETVNFNGNACEYQISGTYTVAADGTGTDAIDFTNGGTGCASGSYTQSLTVIDGGNMVLLSNTNSPDVATEHWYRAGGKLTLPPGF
jgi:hypothetical protein